MTKRTRPKQIKFWATEEELKVIDEKVKLSNLTKQEYLLRSSLDKNILVIDGLKELLLELSKEGNNLNSLSRNVAKGEEGALEDIKIMQDKLIELWKLIEKTLKEGKE
ncbi:plasmid mobilization relaxosome protein MobC [uncultured Clostridium sp.]|uniref:plasmid mobilization protein n=1 Tax=uncultured Clostridium sp. TaxID=59620 RepID=UPI0025EF775F|nr:plasmid mobilization relaxosome protein MobC [uncultured Clostridium sp.]